MASYAALRGRQRRRHDGQVWLLDPCGRPIELKLIFAYTPADQDADPDGPDNITVSPYGGVILAEDGEGTQHLVGAGSQGETFFLARNEIERLGVHRAELLAGPPDPLRQRPDTGIRLRDPRPVPLSVVSGSRYTTSPWRIVFSVTVRGSTNCSR